jgi:hypothetical protein
VASAPVTVPFGPATVNVAGVRAGDTNDMQVTIISGGTPMDLTGVTVSAQARELSTDETPAITATVTVTDAAGGVVVVLWDGDDVRGVLAGAGRWDGVWDLQVDNAGDVTTVAAGTFEAVMDVTRA